MILEAELLQNLLACLEMEGWQEWFIMAVRGNISCAWYKVFRGFRRFRRECYHLIPIGKSVTEVVCVGACDHSEDLVFLQV